MHTPAPAVPLMRINFVSNFPNVRKILAAVRCGLIAPPFFVHIRIRPQAFFNFNFPVSGLRIGLGGAGVYGRNAAR